jgi:AMMECR1 domain-containing protein
VDSLPALARSTLDHYFATGQVLSVPDPLPQEWQRSSGLFVTLSLEGQTRGCWGTIQATAPNLALATIRAVIGAATRDWRYPPLKASELSQIAIQVAIVHDIHPIDSVTQLDPTRSGLLIRSGNQGAVLLPGEALTPQWQLSTARQLAGIPPQAPVHLFRVEAELIHEFSP